MEKLNRIPRHVAIIMDGNRRWAKQRLKPVILGHRKGAARLEEILIASIEYGIEVLTVYGFSTENNKRAEAEVKGLMELIEYMLKQKRELMKRNKVRFRVIGDRKRFSKDLLTLVEGVEEETAKNDKITFVIALNYGSHDEIKRAVSRLMSDYKEKVEEIDENVISSYLDTAHLPPIDMLIRTSGEMRLSNFLLWQSAYAELFFEKTLWPDFDKSVFSELLEQYGERQRRIGS